jgi:hypothetical protein
MKKNIKTMIKLGITVVLLGYILWSSDLAMIFERFLEIPLIIWVAALILQTSSMFISTLRLSLFLPDFKFRRLLFVRLVSNAYGFILPGQLAVEGMRAYLLGKEGKEYSQPGAAVIVDKIIGIIAILSVGIVGLLITRSISRELIFAFCVCGSVLILFLLSLNFAGVRGTIVRLLTFLSRKTGKLGKVFSFSIQVLDHWQNYIKNKRLLIKNFIFGVLFQLLCIFMGILFTYGVGAGIHIIDWLWIHAILAIALILPITIGGIGIREAGLIGLLGLIGVSAEQALAVSFGLLTLNLIQALIGIGLEIGMTLHKRLA